MGLNWKDDFTGADLLQGQLGPGSGIRKQPLGGLPRPMTMKDVVMQKYEAPEGSLSIEGVPGQPQVSPSDSKINNNLAEANLPTDPASRASLLPFEPETEGPVIRPNSQDSLPDTISASTPLATPGGYVTPAGDKEMDSLLEKGGEIDMRPFEAPEGSLDIEMPTWNELQERKKVTNPGAMGGGNTPAAEPYPADPATPADPTKPTPGDRSWIPQDMVDHIKSEYQRIDPNAAHNQSRRNPITGEVYTPEAGDTRVSDIMNDPTTMSKDTLALTSPAVRKRLGMGGGSVAGGGQPPLKPLTNPETGEVVPTLPRLGSNLKPPSDALFGGGGTLILPKKMQDRLAGMGEQQRAQAEARIRANANARMEQGKFGHLSQMGYSPEEVQRIREISLGRAKRPGPGNPLAPAGPGKAQAAAGKVAGTDAVVPTVTVPRNIHDTFRGGEDPTGDPQNPQNSLSAIANRLRSGR